MTGLLLGILLARTVSGLVAQAAGWRAIYWLSAGAHARLRRGALAGPALRGPAPAPQLPRAGRVVAPPAGRPSPCCAGGPGTAPAPSPPSACCGPRWPSCSRAARTTTPTRSSGSSASSARAGSWRPTSPASWPTRPGTPPPPSSPASSWPAPSRCSGPAARRWPPLIIGIVVLDMGTQGMQITNQAVIYALRPDAAEPDQQRLHGLLLPRRRRRLPGRRRALRHARLGGRLPPRGRLRPPHAGHVGLRPPAAGRPRAQASTISSPLPS